MDTSNVPFFEGVIGVILVISLFELYLDIRQHNKFHEKKLPKQLEGIITQDKFEKAQLYGFDKSSFGFIVKTWEIFQSVLILWCSLIPWFWNYSLQIGAKYGYSAENEIIISLVFAGVTTAVSTVLEIPFELYSTFVVEEKHGFNKQTIGLYVTDKIKSLILTAIFGVPLLSGFLYIIEWGGDTFYIYVWAFMFAVQIIAITIYPTLIQPLFNKVEPLEEGELKSAIEALAKRINFPLTKLFKIDGSKRSGHSNAYFFGFFKNKRIVLYDTLIENTEVEEVVGVLGHELGHWKLNHTVQFLIIGQIQLLTIFWMFGKLVYDPNMYASFGFDTQPILMGFILFQMIFSPVESVISFLMNAFSRQKEFEADNFSKKLGYGKVLKDGLVKLQEQNLGNMNPDPWYSTYHYSHPPLVERLNAIGKPE